MRALQLVPAAVLLLTSSVASAGLTLTYERKKTGGEASTAVMMFEPGHIRMENMGGGGPRGGSGHNAVILDAGAKKVLIVDSEKKSYSEITEADAKMMKERMEGMKAQMQERMKSMPPEHRKQAEEMMNRMGGGGTETKYESLGKKKKVAGFDCEMYKVTIGAMSSTEQCIAPWGSSIVSKSEAEQFRKSFTEMEKAFAGMGPMRANDWAKAPGIPVEMIHVGADGKPESTTTLKSVNRGSIAASQFQVPSGYTKQERPMMGGGMGPGGPHGGPGGPGGPHGGHGAPGGTP